MKYLYYEMQWHSTCLLHLSPYVTECLQAKEKQVIRKDCHRPITVALPEYYLLSVFIVHFYHNLRVSLPKIFKVNLFKYRLTILLYNNECAHIHMQKYLDLDFFFHKV